MGKLSGSVLIVAGVALAAYTLAPSSRHEASTQVATAQDSAAAAPPKSDPSRESSATPMVEAPAVATEAARDAAPQGPLHPPAPAAPPAPRETSPLEAKSPPPAALLQPIPAVPRVRPGAPPAVALDEAPPRVPVGDTKAAGGPPHDRPTLAREIQRQLKRIGCYRGNVTGAWTSSVRQAMKTLTDRVNASLPTDQPDPVLLAMVQGQAPGACSGSCPAGESKAADGRCLPQALVAAVGKPRAPVAAPAPSERAKARPPAVARAEPADTADLPAAAEGRMSLAGPASGRARRQHLDEPTSAQARPAYSAIHGTRRAPARTAHARPRERYYAAQRRGSGFSGSSGWVFPFLFP